jgi:citrate synthase
MSAEYNFFKIIFSHLNINIEDERVYDLCNAICASFIEFAGEATEPPSSCVVALVANSGAPFPSAAAAGFSCISNKHLLINEIAEFIDENYQRPPAVVYGQPGYYDLRVPGFGHPSIKGIDPRVEYLVTSFPDLIRERTTFCLELEEILPVHMNIGCAMSALLLDAGVPKDYISYFPMVGRLFGWLKIFNTTKNNFNNVVPSRVLLKSFSENED